jgi:dTDP-4-dehydrorhamnose 3,5-epimerase
MKVERLALDGLLLIRPSVFRDERGYFFESHSQSRYADAGLTATFVQDNVSYSIKNTLRGLHFQIPKAQGKLVSCLQGAVFDVVVDIRAKSPTFAQWCGVTLTAESGEQLWVPPGFAHGFCVLSDHALFHYKCTDYYDKTSERAVAWNDTNIGIRWPTMAPLLSAKDAAAPTLASLDKSLLGVQY